MSDAAGRPVEYSFFEPLEYGPDLTVKKLDSFGELLDEYFGRRDKAERIRQRTADIFRLLTNAENRLMRKIAGQKQDLEACARQGQIQEMGRPHNREYLAALEGNGIGTARGLLLG